MTEPTVKLRKSAMPIVHDGRPATKATWKKGQPGNPRGMKPGTKMRSRLAGIRTAKSIAQAKEDALARHEKRAARTMEPLDFMLDVLRWPEHYPFAARQWAASNAAPYVHRRMPIAIEGGDPNNPLRTQAVTAFSKLSDGELAAIVAVLKKSGVDLG